MIVPNLLITDDDNAFREVLCECFERRGFQVTPASDGAEAITQISQIDFHLALIDVHMPRQSGLDVVRYVTTNNRRSPCVLMSAQWDEQTRRTAVELNAYDLIDKPVAMQRLTAIVHHALADLYGWQPEQN